MNVYLFIIIITIIVGIAIVGKNRKVDIVLLSRRHLNNRMFYCVMFAIMTILLIGLRAPTVGSDTQGYYVSYQADNISLDSFLNDYGSYLKQGLSNFFSEKNTILFHYIFSFFNRLGFSFNACLVVLASVYVVPIVYLILHESESVWKSCYWFLVLHFSIALSGVRISLALGLTAISFIFLMKNKRFASVCFFALALLIHLSSIVFVFAFFLKKIRVSRRTISLLIPVFVVVPLLGRLVIPYLLSRTYYQGALDLQWNLPIYLFFVITSILLLLYSDEENNDYHKMIIIGAIVCGLVNYGALGNLHRYFTQYLCICLPSLLKNYNKSTKIIIEILYLIVGIYLYLRTFSSGNSLVPYEFFWE